MLNIFKKHFWKLAFFTCFIFFGLAFLLYSRSHKKDVFDWQFAYAQGFWAGQLIDRAAAFEESDSIARQQRLADSITFFTDTNRFISVNYIR